MKFNNLLQNNTRKSSKLCSALIFFFPPRNPSCPSPSQTCRRAASVPIFMHLLDQTLGAACFVPMAASDPRLCKYEPVPELEKQPVLSGWKPYASYRARPLSASLVLPGLSLLPSSTPHGPPPGFVKLPQDPAPIQNRKAPLMEQAQEQLGIFSISTSDP